jgi:hypothetical protein
MDKRHLEGQICETILAEYLMRRGFYVFIPPAGFGPVDVIGISGETGKVYLFDAKKDTKRYLKGRNVPHRIHRVLTEEQKLFGVRIAYVNMDTHKVHVVPRINKEDLKPEI